MRSIMGMTEKLYTGELTLVDLDPTELTWVARYAYAQYFHYTTFDQRKANEYYSIAAKASDRLVQMIEAKG